MRSRRRVATPAGDYEATAAIAALVRDAERELGEQASVGVAMPGCRPERNAAQFRVWRRPLVGLGLVDDQALANARIASRFRRAWMAPRPGPGWYSA